MASERRNQEGSLEVIVRLEDVAMPVRYQLVVGDASGRLTIADERIENREPFDGDRIPVLY